MAIVTCICCDGKWTVKGEQDWSGICKPCSIQQRIRLEFMKLSEAFRKTTISFELFNKTLGNCDCKECETKVIEEKNERGIEL